MVVLLAVGIALVSLIITPGYHFYFDITPKLVVLLAVTGVLLAWAALSAGIPEWSCRTYRWFSMLLLLTLISLAVSTVFSTQPGLSLFGTNWRRYGSAIEGAICLLAWLVAVVCAGRPDRVRIVLRTVTLAGAVAATYGIAQYFGWDPLLPRAAYQVGEGLWAIVRPPGTLGYASYFATWLLMVVFLGMALAAMENSSAWRRCALALALVAAFAMWLTGTRAAILGLAVGGMVWFVIRKKVRVTRRTAASVLLAVIAAAAFYYSPLGQPMRSRVRWFAEDPWGGARLALWRDSLRMAGHRPVAGFGPEVFTAEFPNYESAGLARAYPDFSHESPHNMFLDALVAQGIPGLALLLALCGIAFSTLRRPEITAGLAAVIGAQQFTAFTVPTALMFFVVLALLVALEAPLPRPRRSVPLIAASVPVAAALLYLAVRLSAADHTLALTKHALDNGDVRSATAHYQHYESLRLPGGTADLWYARALLGVAAVSAAGDAARGATETAEDPFNAWYNLALFYGNQNDTAGAERSIRAAIAAHPNWFKPHWILAQILRAEGRKEEAKQQAVLAADLDGGKDQEVARTLREIGDPPATAP